ncbi:ROK family protein [Marinilabilia salmonicolor]|uniref:ROK family protein n=1 Tax=Marinilabilia salmonicolor TaxID=989 RepID=UPI00029AC4AC|nr:ROK family protein [Marinilabilia salmonicolor]
MQKTIIGVDLGGTNMRAGRVYRDNMEQVAKNLVPKTDNPEMVYEELRKTIKAVWTPHISGIGIGVPGIVDYQTGVIFDIQNIPSWKEVPLGQMLQEEFKVPVYINNDANCFAAGERFFGAGKQFDDFTGLIIGTGLGAGIIKNGHLLQDQNCGSGEFGMIPYLDHSYEHYCSGRFFEHQGHLSGKEAAQLAKQNNPKATELFSKFGHHLGNAIKTIIFAVDPAAIILGGSVSGSYRFFEKTLKEELATFPYARSIRNLKIILSQIPDIAILGAAALYYEQEQFRNHNQ